MKMKKNIYCLVVFLFFTFCAIAQKGVIDEVIWVVGDEAILRSVAKTGCVVGCEEHQYNGGLNESIAQLLVRNNPAPMEFVGVDDKFGESGTPDELMAKYGLKATNIVAAAKKAIARKK